ncbi:unnamed protein product, partial [Amoebophrya sp. A120]|eukprot:GSA120T00024843001.1
MRLYSGCAEFVSISRGVEGDRAEGWRRKGGRVLTMRTVFADLGSGRSLCLGGRRHYYRKNCAHIVLTLRRGGPLPPRPRCRRSSGAAQAWPRSRRRKATAPRPVP